MLKSQVLVLEMVSAHTAASAVLLHSAQMAHLNRAGLRGQLPLGYDTLIVTQAGEKTGNVKLMATQ